MNYLALCVEIKNNSSEETSVLVASEENPLADDIGSVAQR